MCVAVGDRTLLTTLWWQFVLHNSTQSSPLGGNNLHYKSQLVDQELKRIKPSAHNLYFEKRNLRTRYFMVTHHYLVFAGRRYAAVVKVVPLPIIFVLGVSSIWGKSVKDALSSCVSRASIGKQSQNSTTFSTVFRASFSFQSGWRREKEKNNTSLWQRWAKQLNPPTQTFKNKSEKKNKNLQLPSEK